MPTCHVILHTQIPAELIALDSHHVTKLQSRSENNVSGVFVLLVVLRLVGQYFPGVEKRNA